MIRSITFLIVVCMMTSNVLSGQLNSFENLEEVAKKGFLKNTFTGFFKDFTDFGDPFQLGGGIGLNMRSYDAFGGPLRQDPFFYTVNANLNVRIFQVDLPFSMVLTAKNKDLSYPSFSDLKDNIKNKIGEKRNSFARIGLSPYYKWVKLHLGHRSMNFSKYTLSNLNFFGVGMELTPDKLRIGAMYGRLAKAEPIDLSLTTPNLPVYQRIGWGTKVGYGDDKASADLILFGAKDDANSIAIPAAYPTQVAPEENLAIGILLQKLFFDRIRVKVEYTNSVVSPNAQDARSATRKITDFLIPTRNTTYFGNAFEGSIGYEGKAMNAGVIINRVDPKFKTLGAYFFNRDIMDIQGFTGFSLIDGKLNTNLKAGIQTNNLDNSKPTTTRRFIYDIQSAWTVESLSISGNYSNNASRIGYVLNTQLDSLNAVIITSDIGLNINYTLPPMGEYTHLVSLTGNIQNVSDDIEKLSRTTSSRMLLGNISYMLTTPSKWAYSVRGNYNQNEVQNILLTRIGFGLGVRKSLFENKLSVGLDGNCFLNSNQLNQNSRNLIGQISLGYQIFKGMGLQLQWGVLSTISDNTPAFTESTGNLGLQYQFNYTPKKKSSDKK